MQLVMSTRVVSPHTTRARLRNVSVVVCAATRPSRAALKCLAWRNDANTVYTRSDAPGMRLARPQPATMVQLIQVLSDVGQLGEDAAARTRSGQRLAAAEGERATALLGSLGSVLRDVRAEGHGVGLSPEEREGVVCGVGVLSAVLRNARGLAPHVVADALWGLADLGAAGEPAYTHLLRALAASSHMASAQDMCIVLGAAAVTGDAGAAAPPGGPALTALLSRAVVAVPNWSAPHVAVALHAWAVARMRHPAAAAAAAAAAVRPTVGADDGDVALKAVAGSGGGDAALWAAWDGLARALLDRASDLEPEAFTAAGLRQVWVGHSEAVGGRLQGGGLREGCALAALLATVQLRTAIA